MPPIEGLTGRVGFDAQILTQDRSVADKTVVKKSLGFKIGQIISGIFTAGIAAGIMELIHSAKEKSVQRDAANSLVRLKDALLQMPAGKDVTTQVKMCGQTVTLHQLDNNQLKATIEGSSKEIDVPFNARNLAERIEVDMMKNARLFDKDEIFSLIEKNYDNDETAVRAENSRFRMLCTAYLEENVGFRATELSSMSTALLNTFVTSSINDPTFDKARMMKLSDTISNAYRINSEECLELLDKLNKTKGTAKTVDISKVATEKPRTLFSTTSAQDVRNLAADLVLNRDTWTVDKNISRDGDISGERLKTTLLKHSSVLSDIVNNRDLLNAVSQDVRPALEELADRISEKLPLCTSVTVNFGIRMLKPEVFKELEADINQTVQDGIAQLQDQVNKSFEEVFSASNKTENKEASSVDKAATSEKTEESSSVDKTTSSEKVEAPSTTGQAASSEKSGETKASAQKGPTLDEMLESAATDMKSNGYGKFMKDVMSCYFSRLSDVDKRAVIAAGIRYAGPDASQAAQLGAILKGAGPIMQKMLQGINTARIDPDVAVALKDMKDNLAPIQDDIIKAYLTDIVDRSQGQITKIDVVKSLGAASVGQALLCRVFTQEKPEGEECVIKLLRPDVQSRADREQAIFEEVAKTIPGMEETFKGQVARIREEMDLRMEGKNIQQGAVYDGMTGDSLQSMKLHPLASPTVSTLVLEKAPGTTLNKFMEEKKAVLETILKESGLDDDSTEPKHISPKMVVKYRETLEQMYQELSTRQKHLLGLVTAWVTEGVYGNGFYHGDLHSGNIMTDEKQMTVIDFGNATRLTNDQQCEITRLTVAAAVGDVKVFLSGFRGLLSDEGKAKFDANKDAIRTMLDKVLHMGKPQDTGKRIGVALVELQKLGLEAPGPIFNFSQCQLRLQGAVDEINSVMTKVKNTMKNLWNCSSKECTHPLDIDALVFMEVRQKYLNNKSVDLMDLSMTQENADTRKLVKEAVQAGPDNEDFKTYITPYMEVEPALRSVYQDYLNAIGTDAETLQLENVAKFYCSAKSQDIDNLEQHLKTPESNKPEELDDFSDIMGAVVEENLSVSARRIGLTNFSRFLFV